ncbi:uncharacterized protein MONOS_9794 [Monocercomonoides exilis]|uniref:uncharacterized protein n=1 Tax=Monocercomonoides exilis TaxID=2049356 RepID=UPI00355973C3|nr:hypothetical protein MONOS_9794 [Monocercomonoides exilis]|eukprot:MONOS_9794.1-p1 / transcript=MONOS_9794.1 / gene=MONOS_9794 / organism=Monocercomonoides_exilis_PA203 / gene_product=unspecified product / transcript_product=unspecified product / location=Mono_scaffold00417:51541-52081(+) / protein_length=165 / sequence_SO=supercontig / SO=protein_coding / is_pseudo=false
MDMCGRVNSDFERERNTRHTCRALDKTCSDYALGKTRRSGLEGYQCLCEMGARLESGQEYYTILPVQDTNWILETIGGPAPQSGEDNKPHKSGESKEGRLEIAEADMKDCTEESPKSGLEEGKKPTRKRSKRRESQGGKKERKGRRCNLEAQHPDYQVVRGNPP